MCGIAGSVLLSPSVQKRAAVLDIVSNIVSSQDARGPDNNALRRFQLGQAAVNLGHNRLSIIDLSMRAHQPMTVENERFWLTYNGEIYNHQALRQELIECGFRPQTQSDSEVILLAWQAWGEAALSRFNGMFAFALLDTEARKLYLVRDRFAQKPLYYSCEQDQCLFASSAKVIAKALSLTPNFQYLARGLAYRVYEDGSEATAYEKLNALTAGHYLTVDFNNKWQVHKKAYYDFHQHVSQIQQQLTKPAHYRDEIAHLINDSVALRLRADVPVALSLSGGLDSSTICALASRHESNLHAFTFGKPEQTWSEASLAGRIAKKQGVTIHYIWPEKAQLANCLQATLQAQEAPFPSTSIIAQNLIFHAVKAQGIKVLLGGQGGDEAFMGYRKFQLFYWQHLRRQGQHWQSLRQLYCLLRVLLAESSQWQTYRQAWQRYQRGQQSIIQWADTLAKDNINLGLQQDLHERQIADILQFSLPTLLRYEDRNAMAHSVESRLPFLDYRLQALAVASPVSLKLHNAYGKWVIRDLMKTSLDRKVCFARYKRGFDIGQSQWFNQLMSEQIQQLLHQYTDKIKPFLSQQTNVDNLFTAQRLAQNNQLFADAITLIWLGENT